MHLLPTSFLYVINQAHMSVEPVALWYPFTPLGSLPMKHLCTRLNLVFTGTPDYISANDL